MHLSHLETSHLLICLVIFFSLKLRSWESQHDGTTRRTQAKRRTSTLRETRIPTSVETCLPPFIMHLIVVDKGETGRKNVRLTIFFPDPFCQNSLLFFVTRGTDTVYTTTNQYQAPTLRGHPRTFDSNPTLPFSLSQRLTTVPTVHRVGWKGRGQEGTTPGSSGRTTPKYRRVDSCDCPSTKEERLRSRHGPLLVLSFVFWEEFLRRKWRSGGSPWICYPNPSVYRRAPLKDPDTNLGPRRKMIGTLEPF